MKSYKLLTTAIAGFCLLCAAVVLSLCFGSKQVSVQDLVLSCKNLLSGADNFNQAVIQSRIPRTVLAIMAGACLAVSGALMQSVTRNPIADPGILGINSGASLAVVAGLTLFGITSLWQYVTLALLGAFVTCLIVYCLAILGSGQTSAIKLALSGAAVSTAFSSLTSTLMIPDNQVINAFRFWQMGSVGGATWQKIVFYLPFMALGICLAVALIPSLNTLSLGDEMAASLGVNVLIIRLLGAVAGVVLCGVTTALCGPIGFVGLMIPHLIKLVFGNDLRYVIPFSALYGACLLTFSDVAGRVLVNPGELEVGILTAFIGAPVFILIIKTSRVKSL